MTEASAAIATIERKTLHDEVVERMRDMVIEGSLAAGQRINETELCEQLGISRTPVREAVKTLASEGLIELVRNKGAVVRRLTAGEISDMLEAIAMIESHAAIVGVKRASDTQLAEIVEMHTYMRQLFEKRDRLPYYKVNQVIHSALVGLANNDTLASMHETLQMRLRRMRYVGNEQPESWSGAMREHEAMMKALSNRDGEALSIAISDHLEQTRERVVAFLDEM